jgi:hypothetical protein
MTMNLLCLHQLEGDLIAGLALVIAKENWTQHSMSVTRRASRGLFGLLPAKSWTAYCTFGAVMKAVDEEQMRAWRCVEELTREMAGCHPIVFNDTHSHAEVVAAWQRAIGRVRDQIRTAEREPRIAQQVGELLRQSGPAATNTSMQRIV